MPVKLVRFAVAFYKHFFLWDFCMPPLPPRPFTPAGVKGGLNTQFGCFGPDRGIDSGRCGAGLFVPLGKRGSRSQWMGLGAAAVTAGVAVAATTVREARQRACAR